MVRWKRSKEGFVDSHCGRWAIVPEYWSCVNPQAYTLMRDGKIMCRGCSTQREAKLDADRLSQKEAKS